MKTKELEISAGGVGVANVEEETTQNPTETTTNAVKELSNFELLEIEDGSSVVVAQGCLSCS